MKKAKANGRKCERDGRESCEESFSVVPGSNHQWNSATTLSSLGLYSLQWFKSWDAAGY